MLDMTIGRVPTLEYEPKEAFNTLCANLSFVGKDIKKILITSCRPTEGKSSVSMELLRSLAGLGMRVVLVDADIRASALQGRYDIQVNMPEGKTYLGLSRYLAGYCDVDDILGATNIRGAYIVLSGRNVTNSLPLISSNRLDKLMDELGKRFDIVLVDTPPVGAIIDAAKIARCCDGTLFVVKSGLISKGELLEAMRQMESAGSQILGTVLNQFNEKRYGGGYYHKSYYSQYGNTGRRKKKSHAFSSGGRPGRKENMGGKGIK